VIAAALAAALAVPACGAILAVTPHPIVSARRLELTRVYARTHYGIDSAALKAPQLIVIHDTEIGTLEGAFAAFAPDALPAARAEIAAGGEVNVGVHFVVDRDGKVYSLLPLDVMGRHTIGFNHVSIGIENVAKTPADLTDAQAAVDAALVSLLVQRVPSIRYLIGHHEYRYPGRPHDTLYKELDPSYAPTKKSDPGPDFMRRLRARLAAAGVRLLD